MAIQIIDSDDDAIKLLKNEKRKRLTLMEDCMGRLKNSRNAEYYQLLKNLKIDKNNPHENKITAQIAGYILAIY